MFMGPIKCFKFYLKKASKPGISKGVSPIIATILLVMITVSLIASAYVWFIGMGESAKEQAERQITTSEESKQKLDLPTAFQCDSNICFELRAPQDNTLSMPINKTVYYINDEPKNINIWYGRTGSSSCLTEAVSGMVASWHFDEGMGNITYDDSGEGCNGVLLNNTTPCFNGNCPTWVEGMYGKAIKLDGKDDWINITNSEPLKISGAITVDAWFYANDIKNDYLVTKSSRGGNRSWDLSFNNVSSVDPPHIDDDYIEFRIPKNSTHKISSGKVNVSLGQWYHVVAVYKPSTYIRLYLNGELMAENDTHAPPAQYTNNWSVGIGARSDGVCTYFNGTIDEVHVWNRSLTGPSTNCTAEPDNEICNLYNKNTELKPGENCYGKIIDYDCKVGDVLRLSHAWGAEKAVVIEQCWE